MGDSMIKDTLKSLCCSNGWSYGVLWGFDQRNSLLLTLQDAYYGEQMGAVIDDMLLQVHVVGGGVIGLSAFTKNHQWMFSDHHWQTSLESVGSLQDDSEFYCQFATGIKTIAVISVEPFGVVQIGSTQKIPETKEFVDRVKRSFRGMGTGQKFMLSENETSSSDSLIFGTSRQFTSLASHGISAMNHNFQHGEEYANLTDANYSSVIIPHSFPSALDHQFMNTFDSTCSLSEDEIQLQQLLLEPSTCFDISTQAPSCVSGDSVLTSSWHDLPCELRNNAFFSKTSSFKSCSGSSFNVQMSSASTSLHSHSFSEDLSNNQNSKLLLHSTVGQGQRSSNLSTFEELFPTNDFKMAVSKASPVDDLSQWFSPPPDQSITSSATELCNSVSHATGLIPVANSNEQNSSINISENCPTNSLQSSITDAFYCNGKEKCSKMSGIEELFNSFKEDPVCKRPEDSNNVLKPVVNTDNLECTSEKRIGSKVGTNNSLFSKLGLDHHHFDGIASSSSPVFRSGFEGQASSNAKRRKIENYSQSQNQVKFQGFPSFDGKLKPHNTVYNPCKTIILEPKNGTSTKEADSWIGDSSSMNTGNSCSPVRNEQLVQTEKKKAKPGSRPRPKDRQQIQDRLSELRGLIPNGDKMSIDRLLERTIRHLNFMQSLTRHSQSVKLADKPKNSSTQNDNSSSCSGGVTWACEVGDQTMVCPLVVEDLSNPGQMLIEILFEEHGSFLEIADIIRGYGLTILKGVMKIRETKIWAHFIVEAEGNRYVTRHEIFPSLIQLLQITSPSGANASHGYDSITESGAFLLENHQPVVSLPESIGLPVDLERKFEPIVTGVAVFVLGCVAEKSTKNIQEHAEELLLYNCVLNSKALEESMANYARWEPAHGGFNFQHPWKQYLKIGALTRNCAYCIEALNSCINSENQALVIIDEHLRVSSSSSRILKELATSINTMTRSSKLDISLDEMNCSIQELQNYMKNLSGLIREPEAKSFENEKKEAVVLTINDVDVLEIMPLITFASLLIEIAGRVEQVVDAVEELANLAEFKDAAVDKTKQNQLNRSVLCDEENLKTLEKV
ncbi:BHLH domain-containing protein [Abeliophyllum distichum]|uniref:BHLH domain-containing protein n=1 Tax=Abeliophyllum distichum TaxID=126358 RepID=A0ABD1UTM0_9LAMI